MKHSKIILLILSLLFILQTSYSIDTVSTKYLPLQVGNVWVYQYVQHSMDYFVISGIRRVRIVDSTFAYGHIYFVFQLDGGSSPCGPWQINNPFLIDILAPLRIDSINGNVMILGNSCQWQINEHLLDSLKVPKDSAFVIGGYNTCNVTRCYDTSQQTVFGVLRKTKQIGVGYVMDYQYYRQYANNIGIIWSHKGCELHYWTDFTLLGAVVNNILYGDTSYPVGINSSSGRVPDKFSLFQNYPNPFNPSTKIKYLIPDKGFVKLTIYDVVGNEISVLVNEEQNPGTYEAEWNGLNFSSGVYFYKLQAGDFSETRKMTLIK